MPASDHGQLADAIRRVLEQLAGSRTSLVPVVAIARQAATMFHLDAERRWLDMELRGYDDPHSSAPKVLGETLGVDESSDLPERVARCRALVGEVVLEFAPETAAQPLPYPYFATQSIGQLEAQLARGDGLTQVQVPWRQLPPIFHQMFREFGITETVLPVLPVYFRPAAFSKVHHAIKAELAGFLATALVMCRPQSSVPSVVHQYNNHGQVGAMGPNATAIGNIFTQPHNDGWTKSERDRIGPELAELRAELVLTIVGVDEAIEVGVVAEAEKALAANDRAGVFAALRRLAEATWNVGARLRLEWLSGEARTQLGLPVMVADPKTC